MRGSECGKIEWVKIAAAFGGSFDFFCPLCLFALRAFFARVSAGIFCRARILPAAVFRRMR
ncbi:MAG: hypothetical protein DBX55_09650 [Verrucomicrobia bacterium]|nr:MAG: hypothetical protein DBX55_09650 [Verrucomicrobiota bacterium]